MNTTSVQVPAPRRARELAISTTLPRLERYWTIKRETEAARAASERLERSLRLPRVLCRLLALRGHAAEDSAKRFLKPRLERLHDPFRLAGMDAAVERIARALDDGETILVHGDYDVDGMCSAALYTRVLESLGGSVVVFVPDRRRDGYDLSHAGVRAAAAASATLILTADCGTVAHDAIAAATEAGIDVVVTDHHTPGPTLPPACAVVNPNRADCAYPEKGLAGAGVAFKLCQALLTHRGKDAAALRDYLDLVAVATIADLAPLSGENRVLARFGLRLLPHTQNPGLRALLQSTGIDAAKGVTAGQVGHVLAPRLNAVGRMGDAGRGVRLLLATQEADAARRAEEMERENELRRTTDRATLAEALSMLERDFDPERDHGVVLATKGWHPGVIGIVASRVVEYVHRPAVLIAIDGDTGVGRGSARSIPGFHLYHAIRDCGHLLERFGGHRQAAGMEVRMDRIDAFREAFNDHARAVLSADDLRPRLKIDLELELRDVTPQLFTLLRHFGPFGIGNPGPTFAVRGVRLARPLRVVGAGHARMLLEHDGARLAAIGFGMAERVQAMDPAGRLDVVFQLQEDRWHDRLQARLLDVRVSR